MSDQTRRGMTLEEMQPNYDDPGSQPRTLTRPRRIDGIQYVAGRAPIDDQINYDVMFVTVSVEEDEATAHATSTFGFVVNQPPEYLKGATGIIKDVALRAGVDIDKCYYTAVCKWLLPRAQRARPPKKIMKWGLPILEDEIKRVQPKIIVCLGKPVFDLISDAKVSFDDAHGCWFWSERYQAHMYVMHAPYTLIGKPEYYEMFRIDFKEVQRRKELLDSGAEITGDSVRFQVLRSLDELEEWTERLEELVEADEWPGHRTDEGKPLLAVDCEWHGRTHVDGQLRTIQFAWSERDAVVIEFRDEQNQWSFDLGDQEGQERGSDATLIARAPETADKKPDTEVGPIGRSASQLAEKEGSETLPKWTLPVDKMTVTLEAEVSRPYRQPIPEKVLSAQRQLKLVDDAIASGPNRNGDSISAEAAAAAVTQFRERMTQEEADTAKAAEKARYAAVGRRLAGMITRIDARFIGHHFAADSPWMQHWLGIETYEKCDLDTEFAQQTCDESSELGLERGIAMKYTNLGRYDQDLVMWKRANKALCEGGYGYIPSKILHPYGAKDVIAPYRAYPLIKRQLEAQRLWDYYKTIFNPYVTDVFTEFCMVGLPMDIETMDQLRELIHFVKDKLNAALQRRIANEAKSRLRSRILLELGLPSLQRLSPAIEARDEEKLRNGIKERLAELEKLSEVNSWLSLIGHFIESPAFNIRSPDMMRRWLFDVEGLTPIKSTNQKGKGLPSMAWEKVLELPKDRQSLYTPAVDKQTLQILAEQFKTLDQLLDLNAVGNLAKAFLKEAEVYIDEETGEEVRDEHGLHAWLASDGRIHGQMSTTETSRSRSWAPNTLNYPAYVNKRIARSVTGVVQEAYEDGSLPDSLMRWVGVSGDDLPSIRSCIKAPPGWMLVESDYATAEMVALAEISGDKDLRRILHEPDPEWVKLKPDNPYQAKSVRVSFSAKSSVPVSAQDPRYILHVWDAGECLGAVTDDMLAKDANGKLVHAKYDIHWSLAEATYGAPREMMKSKVQRNAAKVINFSSAYGATANSLERKIEADTGVKPEPGTGERGLEAIAERQPRATQFLEEMARVPKERGFYRAASGRIRHCLLHGAGSGVGWRIRNSLESALGREMRNYPMQESVGATSARACKWLLHAYRKLGLKARVMTCLYDSVVSLCPLEERFLVARLHDICMSERNTWDYNDEYGHRTLRYSIDNDFNWRWSTTPSDEDINKLKDPSWHPPGKREAMLTAHANLKMLVS